MVPVSLGKWCHLFSHVSSWSLCCWSDGVCQDWVLRSLKSKLIKVEVVLNVYVTRVPNGIEVKLKRGDDSI